MLVFKGQIYQLCPSVQQYAPVTSVPFGGSTKHVSDMFQDAAVICIADAHVWVHCIILCPLIYRRLTL